MSVADMLRGNKRYGHKINPTNSFAVVIVWFKHLLTARQPRSLTYSKTKI
jgi:hypothetical protein